MSSVPQHFGKIIDILVGTEEGVQFTIRKTDGSELRCATPDPDLTIKLMMSDGTIGDNLWCKGPSLPCGLVLMQYAMIRPAS